MNKNFRQSSQYRHLELIQGALSRIILEERKGRLNIISNNICVVHYTVTIGVGHRIGGQWLHLVLSLLPPRSQLGQSIMAALGGRRPRSPAALRAHHSCDNRSRFARRRSSLPCIGIFNLGIMLSTWMYWYRYLHYEFSLLLNVVIFNTPFKLMIIKVYLFFFV